MRNAKLFTAVLLATAVFAGEASAKRCLTGAAVGGTAGHFAGKHALIGAGVGCAIGRHRANKKERAAAAASANSNSSNAATTATPVVTPATTK